MRHWTAFLTTFVTKNNKIIAQSGHTGRQARDYNQKFTADAAKSLSLF